MNNKDYTRIFVGFLLIFLAVVGVAFLKTKSIEEKNSKNYGYLENIYKIKLAYREIASIASNELSYINYDLLNQKFDECDRLIGELETSTELALLSSYNYPIMELTAKLRGDFEAKKNEMDSFKALNAVAGNSLRYLGSSAWAYKEKGRTVLLMKIITLGIDRSIDIELLEDEINSIKSYNEEDEIYKTHAKNIIKASSKIREITVMFAPDKYDIPDSLKSVMLAKFDAEQKTDKFIKDALYVASFCGLLLLIGVFLLLSKSKRELYKFHSAIDKSDGFVALTDAQNNITYLNEIFSKTLGDKKLLSRSIFEVFEEDKAALEQMQAAFEQKQPYRGELRIKKEDGYIIAKVVAIALYEDDKLSSAVYMGMDITNEKRLEESLTQINKNLNLLVEEKVLEIKQKDAFVLQHSRFAAMAEAISSIAHQWRQPLNALGIIIQDIKMASEYGELTKEYLNESVLNSKEIITQMSKTIDGFRSFLKSGYEREVFDISFAMQKAVLLCESAFKNSLISLSVEYPKEKIWVDGYLGDLVQSMLSVLINSKENFEQKGIREAKVWVYTVVENGFIYLYIKDNGGGCTEDVLGNIFEPYFSTKGAQLGAGIGLFLVKTVIEKNMSGTVEAYNEDGGLTVTISLPVYEG